MEIEKKSDMTLDDSNGMSESVKRGRPNFWKKYIEDNLEEYIDIEEIKKVRPSIKSLHSIYTAANKNGYGVVLHWTKKKIMFRKRKGER